MEISSIAPKVTIFKGILCDRENNKLKKLQVKLKKWISATGKTVFNIDIQALRDKFCLQLDFTKQELCFLRLEEFQDHDRAPSCFQCFSRRSYTQSYYTKIVLLFYRETDETGGESKCVKVPLIQTGNIHAATTVRKLWKAIHNNIVSEDEVQHWLVSVVTCGHLTPQDIVFFCLTKYAIAVVMVNHYQIMYYHPFYASEISVVCDEQQNILKIEVIDKLTERQTAENDNFTFARQYVFRTSACQVIEKNIKNVLRQSAMNPVGPSAHWNIKHSELSSTDVIVPGTTSDNVMILPHRPHEFDNNNTGSSGSNGHIPSMKISNVILHQDPPPYHHVHQSGSGWSQNFSSSIGPFFTASSSGMGNDVSFEVHTSDKLVPRGHNNQNTNTSKITASSYIDNPSRYQDYGNLGTDPTQQNLPSAIYKRKFSTGSLSKPPAGFFNIDSGPVGGDEYWSFIDNVKEDELPPPPPPCPAQLKPHVDVKFRYKPPPPLPHSPFTKESGNFPAESGQSSWMRSISYSNLTDISMHSYINVPYMMSVRRNVHDDNPYYHFYINIGYVTMSKKLKRRNRMSKEVAEIDFNKLENHEQWYDSGYKDRDKDLRFCRLNKMNIKVEDNQSIAYGYSRVPGKRDMEDDPYWSSDLSITLQKVLQDAQGSQSQSFQETRNSFDLTSKQLISVEILLSLVPAKNNWKSLAEYIGLTFSDIRIIEHFCFTYRELAAMVVLIHWIWMYRKGVFHVQSNFESLQGFLEEMQREDIMNILVNENLNANEDEDEDELEVTHF